MSRFFGILFGQHNDTGWSEVYPISAVDYNAANTVLTSVRTARLNMLASDSKLIAARLSDTDIKGDSFPTGFTTPTPGLYALTTTYETEVAVRYLFAGGTLKRGSRWLHAIPSDCINAIGDFAPTAGFITAETAWLAALLANVSIATKIHGAVAPPFYTFTPLSGLIESQLGTKRIGRPFGLPRGRRLVA